MNNELAKLIIVDDHNIVADGLEQILTREEGFDILAKVDNGKLLIQTLNKLRPDMILLDINMKIMGGLEAALLIRNRLPGVKIVLMSGMYEKSIQKFIKQHDIDGFIIKESGAPQWKEALRNIMNGKKTFIVPAEMKEPEQAPVQSLEDSLLLAYRLTKTEKEIICQIVDGKSSKMIADERGLVLDTIETHRKNIFRKIKAQNMADVIVFAIKHGICKMTKDENK